ncbi:MAG: hypothetical protein NVSMB46_04520 [Candidatus Saccharimonadales bacterium]
MKKFQRIAIIFNPKSTGASEQKAKELYKILKKKRPSFTLELIATTHAGHAEQLAYDLAKKHKNILIVSSSGDGGYHEVINGALLAQSEGHQPICAVLPAGNANDHARMVHSKPLVDLILSGKITAIDTLRLTTKYGSTTTVRYAHSYIGLGLTPLMGAELNKHDLNRRKEIIIFLRTLFDFNPVTIMVKNKRISLDSLVFSNIGGMAKLLTISKDASIDDGKFEISTIEHINMLRLLSQLLKGATVGFKTTTKASQYTFIMVSKNTIQLDGELLTLRSQSTNNVEIFPKSLRCVT